MTKEDWLNWQKQVIREEMEEEGQESSQRERGNRYEFTPLLEQKAT
ncbi:hypothetical protein [Brevibacillus fulvus]|uniref:Uncharacterized protein n=1 Tax=Brevibacillus fulvus TaxID=1125967 RepID=A0A938Y624_9BACL|nr:hypothetical protein [Brevibacillus fulvus]MBM7592212.1 hypothetical protein [Brevibacillus fulvus]